MTLFSYHGERGRLPQVRDCDHDHDQEQEQEAKKLRTGGVRDGHDPLGAGFVEILPEGRNACASAAFPSQGVPLCKYTSPGMDNSSDPFRSRKSIASLPTERSPRQTRHGTKVRPDGLPFPAFPE